MLCGCHKGPFHGVIGEVGTVCSPSIILLRSHTSLIGIMARTLFQRRNSASSGLWRLVQSRSWAEVNRRLIKMPGDKKEELPSDCRLLREAHAKLPILSFAIWVQAPVDVLINMMTVDPSALYHQDTNGRMPMHIACIKLPTPELVDHMLALDPTLVSISDKQGNLPIHYAVETACRQDRDADWVELVESLLITKIDTCVARNASSLTPVDLARRLDQKKYKKAYAMLLKTAVMFDVCRRDEESSGTFSLSSSTREEEEEEDYKCGCHDLDADEDQACGERPPRRNACADMFHVA